MCICVHYEDEAWLIVGFNGTFFVHNQCIVQCKYCEGYKFRGFHCFLAKCDYYFHENAKINIMRSQNGVVKRFQHALCVINIPGPSTFIATDSMLQSTTPKISSHSALKYQRHF